MERLREVREGRGEAERCRYAMLMGLLNLQGESESEICAEYGFCESVKFVCGKEEESASSGRRERKWRNVVKIDRELRLS